LIVCRPTLRAIALIADPGLDQRCPWVSTGLPEGDRRCGSSPTHRAIVRLGAYVEHGIPRSRERSSNHGDNLRAICLPCNEWKLERLVCEIDGLVELDRGTGWSGLEGGH